jgi:hypothetical protein
MNEPWTEDSVARTLTLLSVCRAGSKRHASWSNLETMHVLLNVLWPSSRGTVFGLIQWIASRSTRGSSTASLPFIHAGGGLGRCAVRAQGSKVRFADYSEVGIAKQRSPTMKISRARHGRRSNVPSASNVQNAEFLKVSVSALAMNCSSRPHQPSMISSRQEFF